ncbi:MAG: Rne/Rng family ribonuclease, partial [Acidobacteriota bacterium]
MRKELLVNATPPETRVALLEDQRVVEVFHERREHRGLVGNIYLGRVHRVLPGMQAAFVSIGLDRDAFLYVEDALPGRVEEEGDETGGNGGPGGASEDRPRIDDLVKEGQEIVVQVTKDPLSGKGPRVTAALSLPGRTLVYLPSAREIGISRRISDDTERDRLRRLLEELPGSGGLIARTAAAGAGPGELLADQRYLRDLADRIARQAERSTAPALLHRELDLALRVVRDLVSTDFAAIRVDDEPTHSRLVEFLGAVAPSLVPAVELCASEPPLFETAGVEDEISRALRRHVELSSGGSIVIQQTEALVAIDVNTGKYVGKDALEDTVFATNLEAVPEIARQIRLRDLGGLLVIDFIDMGDPAHRREVFEKLELELARDRARTRILQLSEFGLVEVTRQRSRGNLEKTLTRPCPGCSGRGRVRTDLTLALELRRDLLRPPTLYNPGETIRVRVPPSLA